MKFKPVLMLALLSFLLTLSCTTNRTVSTNFSFEPAKPVAGEEITVTFDAAGSQVEKEEALTLLVFEHSSKEPLASEVVMTKDGSQWKATFKSQSGTRSLVVVFKGDKGLENNEHRGFRVPLYEKNGDAIKGADAAYVDFMRNFGDIAELSLKNKELFKLINNDFVIYPSLKVEYYPVYVSLLRRVKADLYDSLIRKDLAGFATVKDPDENHLVALTRGYEILREPETATKYRGMLAAKFPKNEFVITDRFNTIRGEKDLKKQKEMLLDFLKNFPGDERGTTLTDVYLNAFGKNLDWPKIEKEIVSTGLEPSAMFYNRNARKYLNEKEPKPDLALLISKVALDKITKEKKELNRKPANTPRSLYISGLDGTLAMVAYTRGLAFKKLGKKAEALEMFELSAKATRMEDPSVMAEYLDALAGSGKRADALELAKQLKSEARSNKEIDSLIEVFYKAEKGSGEGLNDLISDLDKKAEKVITAKLRKEQLDLPANDFTLLDTEGQEVTLSKLRGKVVIVDFWATWCGPCIASFPTLKKAVEKYKSDPNVVFLFVNAWETAKDKKKNAIDFMTKNGYPFRVLMDEKDQVITDYEVSGIPTKFIIDGTGKIRFESVGFNDNEAEMLKEIDLMIEMTKK